jgi:hypothetical protein
VVCRKLRVAFPVAGRASVREQAQARAEAQAANVRADLRAAPRWACAGARPRGAHRYETKRAVVMDTKEKKMHALIQRINTIQNQKIEKRKLSKKKAKETYLKKKSIDERWLVDHRKAETKKRARAKSKDETHKKAKTDSQATAASS